MSEVILTETSDGERKTITALFADSEHAADVSRTRPKGNSLPIAASVWIRSFSSFGRRSITRG